MSDDAASVDVPVGGAVMKGRSGLARIWYAAGYSAAGLKAAYRGEAAFRQLVLLNLLLIPLAFLLDVSRAERLPLGRLRRVQVPGVGRQRKHAQQSGVERERSASGLGNGLSGRTAQRRIAGGVLRCKRPWFA
ncbi:hypothetical protein EGI97_14855 [Stutzerimonas xanthomarina]|nr:hypothetical protein EGI97_14855 [Stutzerimonas xanthomarina]